MSLLIRSSRMVSPGELQRCRAAGAEARKNIPKALRHSAQPRHDEVGATLGGESQIEINRDGVEASPANANATVSGSPSRRTANAPRSPFTSRASCNKQTFPNRDRFLKQISATAERGF